MAGRYPVEIRHRGAILDVSELDGLLTAILSPARKKIEPAPVAAGYLGQERTMCRAGRMTASVTTLLT